MSLVLTEIQRRLTEYLHRTSYPVSWAYLFGSTARGGSTPLSDVDVAVYLDKPEREKRVQCYLFFLAELQSALQPMGHQVDLIFLNDASIRIAYEAIKGQLLCANDAQRRVAYETRILSEYFDTQPFQEARHRLLHQRITQGTMGERRGEMIDRRMIQERLDYIERMLGHLQQYQGLTLSELQADERSYHAALYELQTCLEAVTDIGNHLVAALSLRKPEDRGDTMRILAAEGFVEQELAERLVAAIGMRNPIVHGYLQPLASIVHKTIEQDLGDIEAFCRAVLRLLER